MIRIAWVSRHPPLPSQISFLKTILGDEVEIIQISKTFTSADKVVEEIRRIGAKYALLVLPLSMISKMLYENPDIVFLYSVMDFLHVCQRCPEYNPYTDVLIETAGAYRHLRFKTIKKIKRLELVLEDLDHP